MKSKPTNWLMVAGLILLGLIVINATLHLGIGLIGLVFSLIGGILKLVFSKAGLVVIGVALIFYILHNRGPRHTYH